MRKTIAAIALTLASLAGTVPAHAVAPPRLAVRFGERIGFMHDGPACWDYRSNGKGWNRVVLIADEREYRGEACEGPIIAIVRVPRRAHEDSIAVWTTNGRVWVLALRHFD